MTRVLAIRDAAEAALELTASWIAEQHGTPLLTDTSRLDPAAAAAKALTPYLQGRDTASGWIAVDQAGTGLALLGASLHITDEDQPGSSFLPERFAQVGLGGAIVCGENDIDLLEDLLHPIREDARERSITRLMVSTRPHDWLLGSFWRAQGLQPEKWLAGSRTELVPELRDRPVTVRPAVPADADRLTELCLEEHDYHAQHTTAARRKNQAVGPTRRYVQEGLAETDHPRCLVAEDSSTGSLVGCLFLRINEHPEDSATGMIMPRRRAFIGLTSVTSEWRGRGAGTALVNEARRVISRQEVDYIFLFYVDSNDLSRRFWSRRGFSPVALDLAGNVL